MTPTHVIDDSAACAGGQNRQRHTERRERWAQSKCRLQADAPKIAESQSAASRWLHVTAASAYLQL